MRIWHQSFTVLQHLGAYEDALRSHFARVARPGTEIVMHGMDPGTYRSNYPGEDIRHVALQYLHGMQFVAAGLRAQEQGYDAYAISSLPDPALREIRSMLEIPVVGYGESAMLAACLLGRKFGVLAFIAELIPLIEDNVRRYGLEARFAGARDVGFRFNGRSGRVCGASAADRAVPYGGARAPRAGRRRDHSGRGPALRSARFARGERGRRRAGARRAIRLGEGRGDARGSPHPERDPGLPPRVLPRAAEPGASAGARELLRARPVREVTRAAPAIEDYVS